MIIKKQCFCGALIRANGEFKFNDEVRSHFKLLHLQFYNDLLKSAKEARNEFIKLKEKYPKLKFGYSYFDIDLYKMLEGDNNAKRTNFNQFG